MKTNYKIILYLLPIVLLFTTCRKNTTKPADQHFYYYLTKEQLNKTPYFTNPAFDTLTYISNLNDTLVFAKTKTDTLWYISSVFDPGGTADKYYHYQQLRNSYATLKGEGKFEVIHLKQSGDRFNTIQIQFNKYLFGIGDWQIGSSTYTGYIGDFEVSNSIYKDVLNMGNNGGLGFLNQKVGLFYIEEKSLQKEYLLIN
jgi:hypothetical protein